MIRYKIKGGLLVLRSDIDKTTKESTKTQKMTNILTMISQLALSAPQEILLVSKMPTVIFLFYVIVVSVNTKRSTPRKKRILNHQKFRFQ